jgi:16S rRNA processing protein RimM
MSDGHHYITVGHIVGVFGVHGWLKVHSHTSPRENLLDYHPWYLKREGVYREHEVLASHVHGKRLLASLAGCSDPSSAQSWVGCEIAVRRELLPAPDDGEHYWADLIGLRVFTLQGVDLGSIDYIMETGANDVLVVRGERERLVPYLSGSVICEVDLNNKRLLVDWDPEF